MKTFSTKGTSLVVLLVLSVIILGSSILIYKKLGGLDCFKDPFNCFSGKTKIELAVECAAARCIYGCDAIQIDNIKSETLDFSCRDECMKTPNLPWDVNYENTICDFGRPIEIELEKPMNLREKKVMIDLNEIGAIRKCIIMNDRDPHEQTFQFFLDYYTSPHRGIYNAFAIFVEKPLVDAIIGNPAFEECYSGLNGFIIATNKIYISSGYVFHPVSGDFFSFCEGVRPFVYISSQPIFQRKNDNIISLVYPNSIQLDDSTWVAISEKTKETLPICGNGMHPIILSVSCDGIEENYEFCQNEQVKICDGKFTLTLKTIPSSVDSFWCETYNFEVS